MQGLQQLHRSLADAVGASALIDDGASVGNYTALMALALDRLDTLESFYRHVSSYAFMVMQHFFFFFLKRGPATNLIRSV